MKPLSLSGLLVLALMLTDAATVQAEDKFTINGQPVPEVVASVNGTLLSAKMLKREMIAYRLMSSRRGEKIQPKDEEKIAQGLLMKAIDTELIYQKCVEKKIKIDAATIADRKAGNGVVIDHGGGWRTQYSHLRRGSIRVAVGDSVAAGEVLGMIGMSGNAAFPHVEFVVRYQGAAIDPFGGLDATLECGVDSGALWDSRALAALNYTPSGILAAGFAPRRPAWLAARRGDYAADVPRRDAPALVFWTSLFGGQLGDQITMRLIAPGGGILAENSFALQKDKAQVFSLVGRKRPGESWPAGVYRGEYELYRWIDDAPVELLSAAREITLR
ncbi:MAG: M23 family metallopeptidase [Planctomycetes bacterium]|nr:M23 family metallopeptidase [Planctomycetota bacterium]